jgi:integrase
MLICRRVLDIRNSKGPDQHYVVLHDSMLALMRQYDDVIKELYPDRTYFFPGTKRNYHSRSWLQWNFNQLWDKENKPNATPYAFRHHYATSNINNWVDKGFGFDDKLLYLSKSMGHSSVESTKYYYSLVPSLADIIDEKTNVDFEDIVPGVEYEEVE